MNSTVVVWVAAALTAVGGSSSSWVEPYRQAERLREEGAYAAAEAQYTLALQRGQQAGDECPGVAAIDTGLAALHQRLNRLDDAEAAAMQALELWKECPSPHPQQTAATFRVLAVIRSDQGRYPESVVLFQRALETLPSGGSNTALRADITSQLGVVYFLQGKLAEAESAYYQSLDLNERADPPDRLVRASILDKLGELHFKRRNYSEAQSYYESALQLRERELGSHHPSCDDTRIHLARLYYVRGLWGKAEGIFRAVLASSEKQLGSAHPQVIILRNDLGVLYLSEGKTREAEAVFRRAVGTWEHTGDPHTIYSAALLLNWGSLMEERGHWAEAEKSCQQALSTLKDAGAAGNSYMGTAWNSLGRLQYHRREYAKAAESFRKAVEIWGETLGAGHPRSASGLHNLAVVEIAQRHFREAEEHLRASLDIWGRNAESELNWGWPATLRDYASLLKRSGRTQDAAGLEGRATDLEARIRDQQRIAQMTVDVRELQAGP